MPRVHLYGKRRADDGLVSATWVTATKLALVAIAGHKLQPPLSRGSAGQVDVDAPPANFRRDAVGRSRQVRLLRCGGPSQVEESHADAAAIVSEPSRMHTRTETVDKQITKQDTRMAIAPIWRSQMFITPVTSVRSNVRG